MGPGHACPSRLENRTCPSPPWARSELNWEPLLLWVARPTWMMPCFTGTARASPVGGAYVQQKHSGLEWLECTKKSYFPTIRLYLAQPPRSTDFHSQLFLVRGCFSDTKHLALSWSSGPGTPWVGAKPSLHHPGSRNDLGGLASELSCTWLLRISKTERVECVWEFLICVASGSHNTLMLGAPAPSLGASQRHS